MTILRIIILTAFILFLQCASAQSAKAQQAGSMRYNYTSKKMEFHDGAAWHNFALGLPVGGCSREGVMDYDPLLTVLGSYRFCNGTSWIQIVGLSTLAMCSKRAEIEVVGNKLQVCNGLFWVNIKGAPA